MIQFGISMSLPKMTRLTRELDDALDEAVARTAFKIQQNATVRLTRAVYMHNRKPTPTGALRASIYTRTSRSTTYPEATSKAVGMRAKRGDAKASEKVAPSVTKPSKGEAWVGVGMLYGVFIEYPTRGRPGTYFMQGAADDTRGYFMEQVRLAINNAGQGAILPANWGAR